MEHKHPLTIGLVIPAYNEAESIESCLTAVFAQTHPFDEVIVVDNNSTDNTVEIASQFKGVTVITEPKQGVTHTRDTGFDAATTDIIGRIDADSLLEPDWATQVISVFADDSIAASTGPVYYHDMPAKPTGQKFDSLIRGGIDKLSTKSKFLYGSNMAIRRDAWRIMRDVVCHEDAYHEDLDLAIHLTDYDYNIYFDKKMIAGVSSRRMESSPADFRKYMKMYSATYKGHGIREASVNIPIIVFWSLYPSMKLLRGAYNPDTNKISLEKLLLKSSSSRSHPNG
ncbi:glycosyltransferase family 2 protein [Candidatus Saccharibacteria bacterium]|nr:glycosyltransferase family 2 protein [Candidatus Saccharibacteria bacterium]